MAISIAFGSLFYATPASASTLEDAQAALNAGRQEVIDATSSKDAADALVLSTLQTRDAAQIAVNEAQASYDASEVTTTITTPSGVSVTAYINQSRTPQPNWQCSTWTSPNINFSWGSQGPAGCGYDNFSVKFTGTITAPTDGVYRFMGDADDGFYMEIDGVTIINDWYDKGGGGNWSPSLNWTAGSTHSFTAWFYENGGGAKVILNVSYPQGIITVPSTWFGSTSTTKTSKDQNLLAILQQKQSELSTAESNYQEALVAQAQANTRLQNALAAIPELEQAVLDATPRLNAPTNVRLQQLSDGSIEVLWDAPQSSNTAVERYAIFFTTGDNAGWAVSSPETNVYLSREIFSATGGLDKDYIFKVRSDNDTLAVYSEYSEPASILVSAPAPPVIAPTGDVIIGEGGMTTLNALTDKRFVLATAWYGDPSTVACGVDVSAIVTQQIAGKSSAEVSSDNSIFGDPCPGVVKALFISGIVLEDIPVVIEPTPVPVEPTPTPEPVIPTPEPTVAPPVVEPTPEPVVPIIPPVVEPPVIVPQPQPQPIPFPVEPPSIAIPDPEPSIPPTPEPTPTPTPSEIPVIIEPTPIPTEEPVVEPTPEPSVESTPAPTPVEEPTPTPTPSEEPAPEPTKNVVEPLPEPEPTTAPTPTPEPQLPVTEAAAVQAISNLVDIAPENLTDKQVEQLVAAANVVFETAEQGSPEYKQALEALAVAAESDDIELPQELAAIPLLGDVAGAALELFNNLGNIGADMSPEQREKAEETVVAAVVVGQVAQVAAGAAVASAGGASSGGSSGRRIK